MDSQPTVPTPLQQPAVKPDDKHTKKSSRSMALKGMGGFLAVVVIAGATYSLLSLTVGQKSDSVTTVTKVNKVQTPKALDMQIQSDIDNEQKTEGQASDATSQELIDDANSTQTLEGSYDNL